MLIPLAGPFAAAFATTAATGAFFSTLFGVVQIAGATLGIVGAVKYSKLKQNQTRNLSIGASPNVGRGATVSFGMRF